MSDPADNSAVFEITSKIMISVVIVFFVVIVLVFLLHLYARCLWSASPEDPEIVSWRRQLATQNRQSEAARRRQKGLKSSTLKSLPISVYNPKVFKDGLECPICLSELQEGEHARILPNCNHGFHLDCIDKWFHSHSNCPICRTSVEPVLDSNSNSSPVESQQAAELPVFPTNVLFWGDEVQVRTSEESVSSSDSLAIDIPEGESCSIPDNSSSTARLNAEDEAKSPVETRLKSLKRLLSRGKRVNPFPSSSSSSGSADVEQV